MPDTATDPDVLLDDLADAAWTLVGRVNAAADAVTTLVEQSMATAPDACAAALTALKDLLAATEPVTTLVDRLDE